MSSQIFSPPYELAVLCFAAAGFNLIIDKQTLVRRILALPVVPRLLANLVIAVMVQAWGFRRSRAKPQERYLNEAVHSLGALVFALAALQPGRRINHFEKPSDRWDAVLPLLACTYGFVAISVKSSLIWSYGMFVMGIYAITSGNYTNNESEYFTDLENYFIRFVLLGSAMICAAYPMRNSRRTADFRSTTQVW
ncbi:hypothetical protein F4818DRAFT_436490 [Hypoxylon cercidicola]|nr:hypothetical protein F4818DRAFT_436490 [Hypoxylon cercidicola]